MVGRHGLNAFGSGKSSTSSGVNPQTNTNTFRHGGNPFKPKPAIFRFQDGANHALEDERRNQLKHKLIDSVKGDELEKFRKTDEQLKSIKDKKIRHFYEDQNETLDDWLEIDSVVRSIADDILESFDPDRDHDGLREHAGNLQLQNEDVEAFLPQQEIDHRRKAERNARRAINVSAPNLGSWEPFHLQLIQVNVVANILLLAAKVTACFFSSSLSLIASTVDSALDLLCTIIVWTTNRLVQWRLTALQRRFPVGRRRLEPLGILVFSIFMILSFAQILQESVEKLMPSGDHTTVNLGVLAMAAMIATIVIKGVIWFGCIRVKTTQVQALAQDCKTDVYFNVLSLLFPLIGKQVDVWWLDPTGAAILSLFIIWDWAGTAFENVTRLSGSAVDDRLFRKLIFLAWRFAPIVEGFKNMQAYHAGDGVWVEVDILLDHRTPLMRSHDIAETLQYCLEGLPEVDRVSIWR